MGHSFNHAPPHNRGFLRSICAPFSDPYRELGLQSSEPAMFNMLATDSGRRTRTVVEFFALVDRLQHCVASIA